MVDQPEYGTNTSYLVDFIQFTYSAKVLNLEEIRNLYVKDGLSSAQIAQKFGVAKSVILVRLHSMGIREGIGARHRLINPNNYRSPYAPFGYSKRDDKLVINKSELRICRTIVELIQRQKLTTNAVAKKLIEKGFKNRMGRVSWDHSTVRNIYNRWKDKL